MNTQVAMKWTPERIRSLRRKMGVTQAAMGQRLGYRRRESIADLEAGKHEPNPQAQLLLDILAEEHGYVETDA